MKFLSDEQLVELCKNNSEEAIEALFLRYKPILKQITRGYFLLGADEDDLIQEAMIGLHKAILSYKQNQPTTFKTFANLCVRRNILSAIKKSTTQKNMVLNDSLSLSTILNQDDDEAQFLFVPYLQESTEEEFIKQEEFENIKNQIVKTLSKMELQILNEYLKGFAYQIIAEKFNISTKSVDNALSRIKTKLQFLK